MQDLLNDLRKLVDNFKNNLGEYTGLRYDEENTKTDFIDKFFRLLGWDVYNEAALPEDFRDVIREDKVYVEGRSKSPDYAFKYGIRRYFYVEAKRPSVNIHDSDEPAFQLRRYAHSAELYLSILTNFKEFAVYDTRIVASIKDKPGFARIFYCTFEEYEENWEFIYNLFSKQAIMNNSLEKFSSENKAIKGTQPLDKGILQMIEKWRHFLAENIALKNDIDKIKNLNEAVQKIIDRIIFLRIAEDRNTEVEGFLKRLSEEKDIYNSLIKYFTLSNKKYNSGLFAELDWLNQLNVDDKILHSIITDIYYPNPYEFAALPIEILGQIYEQFLGKTITFKRKTKFGHSIEVEEKPEVRKAGGVYYTPQYIVDYIVQNTVGKKLGLGDRDLVLGDWNLKYNEFENNVTDMIIGEINGEDSDLQGSDRLAKVDGFDGDDLQNNDELSEGGKIRTDESNPKGSGLNPGEYNRGQRKGLQKGIPLPSFSSERFISGTGDSFAYSSEVELLKGRGVQRNMDSNTNSKQTINRTLQSNQTKTPVPNPKPQTPKQIEKLTILDPACGSGSFLVGAFKFLLQFHLKYYTDKKRIKQSQKDGYIYEVNKNSYRLTIREKRKILLNNIYGVDIDPQAVEVTKLSLLLALMEGEIVEARREMFFKASKEALLPDLDKNIKCGNSLIGKDFYFGQDQSIFDEDTREKINCFNWNDEFKSIMENGGFDCVIGNPPWGSKIPYDYNSYISIKYRMKSKNMNLFAPFVIFSLTALRENGILGLLLPKVFVKNTTYQQIRKDIIFNYRIDNFIDFGKFPGVASDCICPIIIKSDSNHEMKLQKFTNQKLIFDKTLNQEIFKENPVFALSIDIDENKLSVLNKLNLDNKILSNFVEIKRGIELGQQSILLKCDNCGYYNESGEKYYHDSNNKNCKNCGNELNPDNYKSISSRTKDKFYKIKCISGKEINRYHINEFYYIPKTLKGIDFKWNIHESDRIFIKRISTKPIGTLINKTDEILAFNTVYSLFNIHSIDIKVLLAIINSKLMSFFYEYTYNLGMNLTSQITIEYLKNLPIKTYNLKNKKDKTKYERMIQNVNQMTAAQNDYQSYLLKETDPKSRTLKFKKQLIDILDNEIDHLVYELYGLSKDEISIVEKGV